jgi:hypothetical protein
MPQELTSQELTADGERTGSNTTTTGFSTGQTCTSSGTYRASNKYMDIVCLVAAGDVFPAGADGKKTTWYALTSSLSTNKEGSFSSVKVEAGTI